MASTWKDAEKVDEYVHRVGRLAARTAGEAALVETLPDRCERVLDLGCGDGRLVEVDCLWRWRGFALLVGQAPGEAPTR